MALPWRRRAQRNPSSRPDACGLVLDVVVPAHFRCPISLDLMKDPVTLCTGITYDRESIEQWIESGNGTCPVTKRELTDWEIIPNHVIRKMIQAWCVENQGYGIERIPTPRIPVTSYEASEACRRIEAGVALGDARRCGEAVTRINMWEKESERNRRCIRESGAGVVLATAFDSFAWASIEKHSGLLEEILSSLTWAYPNGHDGQDKLETSASLNCILRFMNSDDLAVRKNAVLVLKEIVSSSDGCRETVSAFEGMAEALTRIIREPICPASTNASLASIYNLTSSRTFLTRALELGVIHLTLDLLVDSDKGTCERVLAVLDKVCDSREGREAALRHALTMPILVKKILRVSNLATELSISIIWKLLLRKDNDGLDDRTPTIIEAIRVGLFQKLLVFLQIGCGDDGIKKKVKDLLKLVNSYKDKVDCVDSSLDLKHINRSP
ncbi:hypothetical protein MLD38_033767 [Melastoma candidum]|uniref:Uncharacterized protein n=2 Tax=Melastoma candidum TaxID=119954 RepID=A0ACB9MA45_9MYRT|nr:hypothetical protein MLD38_033767 [Melastoma candidum]